MPSAQRQRPDQLVGRAREIDELEHALGRVLGGDPYVVEIVGESGIGKSRLLAELGRRAAKRGFLVLDGRTAEFEHDIPFGLIVDAMNDYVGGLEPSVIRALDDDALGELASIMPSLAARAPEKTRPRSNAERYRIHYAVRALLERLATRQPVLLSLDDAHWADPASFEVMAHLLRRFRGRLLAAIAFRHAPKRLAAALEGVARVGSGVRLELHPLTEEEALELIDPTLDAATRTRLYRESGGNPFYLEQLARTGVTTRIGGGQSVALPAGAGALPPAVRAALEGELDGLTDECRLVLDAAAVAGDSFEPDLVGAIAERDDAYTRERLDEMLTMDLLRPTAAPRRFRFRHPIVRRAVYDALPGAWQLGAHARAASALASAGSPAAELAHHVERSAGVGDAAAIELLVGAARDAAPRAPATAGRWLLAAVDLLPLDSDTEMRVGLLAEAASALTSAGAYEDSLISLQEAISLAPAEKVDARAELIAMLAYARRRSGHPFDSRVALEQALGSLGERDSPAATSVRLELALDRLWHDEFDAMPDLTEHLVRVGRQRRDLSLVSLASSLSSLANSSEGRTADAAADLVEAQAAYDAMADDELAKRIYASFYVSLAAVRLERADDALAHVNRGLDVARMTGQAATVIPWPALAALALVTKGRIGEAVAVARTAIDTGGLSRNDWRTVWAMESGALAAYWAGDTERAITSSGEMVRRSQRSHRFLSGPARVQLGGALYAAGDHEAAAAELAPLDAPGSWRLLDRNAAHGWDLLVRVRIALRDLDSAEAAVERALERAEAAGLSCQLATAGCCEASVMLARGDAGGASRQAREACETARAGGNPALRARARAVLGAALAADGRRDQGSKELAGAERALAECGAIREADAAAHELRRLGGRVRRARPQRATGLAALTPRENEIASHVAMGESNREIASALFLSEKTVESHLVRVYAKLGVHSRSALTALIVRGERSSEPGGSSESTVRTP